MRASIPKIKQLIKNTPKEGLADLLQCVVAECVKKKTFGQRPVFKIAETLEKQVKGTFKPAPNQSPMPKERSDGAKQATEAAKQLQG